MINVETISNPILREMFRSAEQRTEDELLALGLNGKIRAALFRHLILPDSPGPEALDECWGWSGCMNHRKTSPRGIISANRTNLLVYRVVWALLKNRNIRSLGVIRHLCNRNQNTVCSNTLHIAEGTAADNIRDMVLHGTIARGDRNGSRTCPESRPRGLRHSKCEFRNECDVQAIRATSKKHPTSVGLTAALARYFNVSTQTIQAVIERVRYTEIPDDDSAALDISNLKLNGPGRSGDASGKTILPTVAAQIFYIVFHQCPHKRERRRLIEYLVQKFGIAKCSLQGIAYSKAKNSYTRDLPISYQADQQIQKFDTELLDALFGWIQLAK